MATIFIGFYKPSDDLLFICPIKIVDFSGDQTRIVEVEGKQVDHMNTTTAHMTDVELSNPYNI